MIGIVENECVSSADKISLFLYWLYCFCFKKVNVALKILQPH